MVKTDAILVILVLKKIVNILLIHYLNENVQINHFIYMVLLLL
jgi:hypothetical protein